MSDLSTRTASGARPEGADSVQPFLLEVPGFRGRLVRLGPALDAILTRHDYPAPVARRLGEALALATAMSNMLRHEGVFTLQTKGDGPVPLLVADVTAKGELRGYAEFDAEGLARLNGGAEDADSVERLMGRGYLAFTLDPGKPANRYQGIVELRGPTLADCVLHYFRQSEQINSAIKLATARAEGRWHAGALLLQAIPEDDEEVTLSNHQQEDWRRALMLMATCTEQELLDASLPMNDLLYRLFHEEQVRVYRRRRLKDACRCSRKRIETVLRALTAEEIEDMKVGDEIVVTCQFCSVEYRFGEDQLRKLHSH